MKTGRGAAAVFTKAMSLAMLFAFAQQARTAPRDFSIPAGPANQTLTQFARQAGLPLALPYELAAGRRTPRVHGRLEPDEALRRLLRGTGLVAERDANGQFLIRRAAPASASRTAPAGSSAAAEALDVEELHEVQVTGSRIDRNGMGTPTPVTAVTLEELESLSPLSLAEALAELPHFLNNDTPQSQSFATSTAAGASYMNLRGIGSIRTLTLVDGRRIVPATRFGTVDYALLPKALLRKVEVVTGGASAAYGSDAVSGVVNLQLDTGFEGFRLRGQGGLSELGDNGNGGASLVWGTRVGEDSHFVLSAEINTVDGIRGYRSRPWFQSWATIIDPAPTGGPPLVLVPDVKASNFTFGGLITSGPLAGTQFLPGGVPAPFDRGRYYTSNSHSGGDGVDLAADMIWMLPDQRRGNLLAKFDTTLAPGFTAFAQVLAGHSRSTFEKDPPALWGQWEATIFADNAFLPAGIRQQMQGQGIASFKLGRSSSGDLGAGRVDNIGNLLSITLGASRELGEWRTEGYYQFGQNHSLLRYTDALRVDRVYRGIDSVVDPASGRIVCRSTLSFPDDGCVPVNLFGEGSISPAAQAWITEGTQEQSQHVAEHVAEVMLQGSLFELPAGRVTLATGINWRREAVDNKPRRFPASLEGTVVVAAATLGYRGLPAAYSGATNIFERTVVNSVSGHYDVWELFGEAAVPLLHALPLVQDLTLHGAVRYAHYSGSGDVPAWKGGLDWTLDDTLRLRVTRSRDVRAGSLSERFDTNGGGATIFDPQATAAPFFYAINSIRTGNPQVDPEQADTWTGGLVLTPQRVPGLSVSADYYDIRIRDAIGLLGAQNIINRCNGGQEYYCTLITRGSASGQIVRVSNLILNLTEARSRGIDVEVEWRRPVTLFGGGESMALRIFGNRMLESSVTGISGTKLDRQDQTGQVGGSPRWQTNLSLAYWRDALHLTVQQRFISPGRFSASYQPTTLVSNRVAGASYTNLRAAWSLGTTTGVTLFAQVNNLFDRNPPRAADFGFAGTVPTNETLFDVIGRRFVVGFSYDR